MTQVKVEGAPQTEVAPPFKYYLETVVACGPHYAIDRDAIIFESGHAVIGAAYVEPGDKVIWVTKGEEEENVGVGLFGAVVEGDKIVVHKDRMLSPLLISAMDRERQRRESEISTVPNVISMSEVIVPEKNMKVAEELIAKNPGLKRLAEKV